MKLCTSIIRCLLAAGTLAALSNHAGAQSDPASEPAVVATGKALPAVVNINTERIIKRAYRDPYDEIFNQFFGREMRPPRELRQKVQSLGSGFIIDPAGYIVTNEHVVERAADLKIQVTLANGKTYSARYISGDASADLALIKIDHQTPLPYISLKDLSQNLLGETLLVIGNPIGYGISVSRGILSATNRSISIDDNEFKGLIQTDAAINPGNSGGPIIDISGKLVGISSVKMAYTPQGVPTQGLGFGIPAATVRDKVAEFMRVAHGEHAAAKPAAEGSHARALFGLQLQDLTGDLADAFGSEPGHGVLIADVDTNSPASEVGLKRGNVIYKIGRFAVNSCEATEKLLERAKAGTVADFQIGAIQRVGRQAVQELQTVSLTARETN